MSYQETCNHVLRSDPTIRFTGIATLEGDIVAGKYGKGLTPLLTQEESQMQGEPRKSDIGDLLGF